MKDFYSFFQNSKKELNKTNSEITEIAKKMVNAYKKAAYPDVDPQVLANLIDLKQITSQPKQPAPDKSFTFIKDRLGAKEDSETLRQERWHGKIKCPACQSNNIKLLLKRDMPKHGKHKYNCLSCGNDFNDDSGTLLETGRPPLSTWMLCWYLMGCTDSLQYIATKLGLDLATVELMVRHMQKIFKSNQPLTHLMSFDEWSLKHGKSYKQRIEHELAKKQELFTGETPNAPKDTAEYRKQKDRSKRKNTPAPKNRNF